MIGFTLLREKCDKFGITIGEISMEHNTNGDVLLEKEGLKVKTNTKKLAEIYGMLTFFHFKPEEAVEELLLLLNDNFK